MKILLKIVKKLPEKIEDLLKKAENANKEYDDNKIDSFINICINVENSIKNIKEINDSIIKSKNYKNVKIKFNPDNDQLLNKFL